MTEKTAADVAVRRAKSIENMDERDELDVLEVKVEASLDGTAQQFIAVTTTGGPHVEVNVTNKTVTAHWGNDSHTTHVDDKGILDQLNRRYAAQWNAAETEA